MFLYNNKTVENKNRLRISVYFTEEVTFKEHYVFALGTGSAIRSIQIDYSRNGTLCLVVDWHYYPLDKVKYICMKEFSEDWEKELWLDIIGQNRIRNLHDNDGVTTIYLEDKLF